MSKKRKLLEELSDSSKKSYNIYKTQFENFLIEKKIEKIDEDVVTDFALTLREKKQKANTIKTAISFIAKYLKLEKNLNLKLDLQEVYSLIKLYGKRDIVKRPPIFTSEEILLFLKKSTNSMNDIQEKLIVVFSYFGCARIAEIHAMKKEDVTSAENGLIFWIIRKKTSSEPVKKFAPNQGNIIEKY